MTPRRRRPPSSCHTSCTPPPPRYNSGASGSAPDSPPAERGSAAAHLYPCPAGDLDTFPATGTETETATETEHVIEGRREGKGRGTCGSPSKSVGCVVASLSLPNVELRMFHPELAILLLQCLRGYKLDPILKLAGTDNHVLVQHVFNQAPTSPTDPKVAQGNKSQNSNHIIVHHATARKKQEKISATTSKRCVLGLAVVGAAGGGDVVSECNPPYTGERPSKNKTNSPCSAHRSMPQRVYRAPPQSTKNFNR